MSGVHKVHRILKSITGNYPLRFQDSWKRNVLCMFEVKIKEKHKWKDEIGKTRRRTDASIWIKAAAAVKCKGPFIITRTPQKIVRLKTIWSSSIQTLLKGEVGGCLGYTTASVGRDSRQNNQ